MSENKSIAELVQSIETLTAELSRVQARSLGDSDWVEARDLLHAAMTRVTGVQHYVGRPQSGFSPIREQVTRDLVANAESLRGRITAEQKRDAGIRADIAEAESVLASLGD